MDDCSVNSRGFTLIELLLAVGISALMVGIVMGTYLGIRKGVSESLVRHEAETEGELIVRRLTLDLESAYLGNPAFPDRFYFEGKASGVRWQTKRLSFASAALGEGGKKAPGIADMGRVTYRLVPSEKEEDRYTLYRDLSPLGIQLPAIKEVVSDRIASLRVVYVDRNNRFFRQWDSRLERWRDKIPTLIRVELTVWDARDRRHTFRVDVHPEQDWMD